MYKILNNYTNFIFSTIQLIYNSYFISYQFNSKAKLSTSRNKSILFSETDFFTIFFIISIFVPDFAFPLTIFYLYTLIFHFENKFTLAIMMIKAV